MKDYIDKEINRYTIESGLRARIDIAQMCGDALVKEYRERVASALLGVGIELIPSEHLKDHQYVVSRGVYEAAKQQLGLS